MKNNEKTVAIAMSGGVDSSVAAALMKDQGYKVFGITMRLWDKSLAGAETLNSSCIQDHSADAKKVCDHLGIEHHVVELHEQFDETIVEPFFQSFMNNVTPNPCVDCNATMKWGALWKKSKELGADSIATGHYVCIDMHTDGRNYLNRGEDPKKDQSYFLWQISPEVLNKTIFPVRGMTKDQVRAIAAEKGIQVAAKKDSQDICFIPDNDKNRFLDERAKINGTKFVTGPIKTAEGKVVGEHKGLAYYTLGQRKGLGVAIGVPAFVTKVDVENNTLYVGPKEKLWSDRFKCHTINWFAPDYNLDGVEVKVQIRYHSKDIPCQIEFSDDHKTAEVFMSEPALSITPGQSAVFYIEDRVIGGGKIA